MPIDVSLLPTDSFWFKLRWHTRLLGWGYGLQALVWAALAANSSLSSRPWIALFAGLLAVMGLALQGLSRETEGPIRWVKVLPAATLSLLLMALAGGLLGLLLGGKMGGGLALFEVATAVEAANLDRDMRWRRTFR